MTDVRLILMDKGITDFDILTTLQIPRVGEIISIGEENLQHYCIKYIQHVVDTSGKFKYVLITGIKY